MDGISPLLAFTDFPVDMALSVASATMTGYFWLVRARKERPQLTILQMRNFRQTLRSDGAAEGMKRLSLVQVQSRGVLIANQSIRQNSIVRFECSLEFGGQSIKGHFGYLDDDPPPWNIGPESTIALSLACFFEVPEDFEMPEDGNFHVEFVTASGHRFPHQFSLQAPEF